MGLRVPTYPADVITARHRRSVALASAVLAAGLLLAGCGSSSSGGTGPSGAAGHGSSSAAATKDIAITYKDGQIDPPPGKVQVAVGTHVHLTVTSDVAEEVHNHYDGKEVEVPAGGTATFDFVATNPGVYEVELHHADKVLTQIQVG
jgi:plastocyanin